MAIMSLILMRFVGLFTASTMNQALVVLGSYAFVLAGSWEGSGEGMTVHHDGRTLV